MTQINFNQKYLLIFIAILIITLFILVSLLFYFLYFSPKKIEKLNVQKEMTQEELLKTLTVPSSIKDSPVSKEVLKSLSIPK